MSQLLAAKTSVGIGNELRHMKFSNSDYKHISLLLGICMRGCKDQSWNSFHCMCCSTLAHSEQWFRREHLMYLNYTDSCGNWTYTCNCREQTILLLFETLCIFVLRENKNTHGFQNNWNDNWWKNQWDNATDLQGMVQTWCKCETGWKTRITENIDTRKFNHNFVVNIILKI